MESKFWNFIGLVAVAITTLIVINYKKEKTMDAGIRIENMDQAVTPGDNFYDYATRGWRDAHPIPADYSRYGAFEQLNDINNKRVREIAETDTGKIGTLYKLVMDEARLNADGTTPVAELMSKIDAISTPATLGAYLGDAQKYMTAFWGDGVALDEKDSEHFLYNIGQGGIGLSRDFFFDNDSRSAQIRAAYKKYIAAQLKNFGIKTDANKIYALEERMAKSFFPKEKLRDPHANYNKMSIEQIRDEFPGFDWDGYLAARGATAAKFININQPSAIAESIAIMNDTDMDLIRAYLKYRVISASAGLLDEKTYDIAFDFYNRTMAGQMEKKPRWKRAVSMLDDSLGEEIGHLYVNKYFSPAAKKRMQTLVENLRHAYEIRLRNIDWMSDETRERALEKLSGFRAKIGYPDKWRDYTNLHIDGDATLFENMMRVAEFEDAFWIEKIGKKNDPTLWYMNAHEINAYYDPSTNEICFPAGILQYPFFDMAADDAFNYGAIGAIIGHEMTHGFDDQGRQFDRHGNLKDWWTPIDAERFVARANVMRDFFNKIKVTDEINANGEFTLGENLADYGGVTIAYTAYKNFGTPSETLGTLTADKRFFIAYANAWATNSRTENDIRLTKTDEHSLPVNRVNGILPHIDAWYDAFDVTPDMKMYIAPASRVKLW